MVEIYQGCDEENCCKHRFYVRHFESPRFQDGSVLELFIQENVSFEVNRKKIPKKNDREDGTECETECEFCHKFWVERVTLAVFYVWLVEFQLDVLRTDLSFLGTGVDRL